MHHEFQDTCPLCEGDITITYEQDGPEAVGVQITKSELDCSRFKKVQEHAEKAAQEHLNNYIISAAEEQADYRRYGR